MSNKFCQISNCDNIAVYNYKYEKGQKFCKIHKLDNMCNKSKKLCSEINCLKNICKYSKLYCTDHYVKEMIIPDNLEEINLNEEDNNKKNSNPNCVILNCTISANYNKKGLSAIYCSKHAKEIGIGNGPDQLRNVRTKLCEYIYEDGLDCIKIALYGKNNKKQFCKDHVPKTEEYTKLNKDKECLYEGCFTVPNYGYKDGIKEYCNIHKLENMIQLFQKCIIDDCNNRARYNEQGKKGAKYCSEHKLSNMKDNTKKICIEENCDEEAHYNLKNNNNGIYCNLHKKENMCSNKIKICKYEDCLIEAYFGTKEDSKQYCVSHKKENMYNFTSKKCTSCNLYEVKKQPYLCIYCNPNRLKKTKELQVTEFLKNNNINFIYNKSTGFSCGNYRPDILIDCNTHFIIVEVDEGQHKQYTTECEFIRMNNIYLSLGLPTIFIRFNPDTFYINNVRNRTVLNTKLKILLNLINDLTYKINMEYIELYYLFYDCKCNNKCNFIHEKQFILNNI